MRLRWPSGGSLAPRLVALALVAGTCRGGMPPDPATSPPPPDPHRPAGIVRVAVPEEPPSLNPVTSASPATREVLRAVLPSFHLVTPEGRYVPSLLAEEPSVEMDGDVMRVRFRLRPEARWSDGEPITVADVSFTWRAMTHRDVEAADPSGFERLVDVEEESPKVGRLVLSPALPGWRNLFSSGRFVLPAHAAEDPADVAGWDAGPPVAGGPFTVGRRVPGLSVLLEANQAFWGPGPAAARVEVLVVPDPITALQLLEAGRIDAVAPMSGLSWARRLGRIPGVTVERGGQSLLHLVISPEAVPDEADRRLLADAIERDRFASVVVREGSVADALVPDGPGPWARYGVGAVPEGDLGLGLTLIFPRAELFGLTARYVQPQLDAVGADVELVPLEHETYWAWLAEGRFDLALWEPRGDPQGRLGRWFGSTGTVAPAADPVLDRLLEEAAGRGPPAERALRAAQRRLARLVPVLPLFGRPAAAGMREEVAGLRPNPAEGILWNAWAWSVEGEERSDAA